MLVQELDCSSCIDAQEHLRQCSPNDHTRSVKSASMVKTDMQKARLLKELVILSYGMAISKEGKINMRKVGFRRGIVKCAVVGHFEIQVIARSPAEGRDDETISYWNKGIVPP